MLAAAMLSYDEDSEVRVDPTPGSYLLAHSHSPSALPSRNRPAC